MKKLLAAFFVVVGSCQNQGEKTVTLEQVKPDTVKVINHVLIKDEAKVTSQQDGKAKPKLPAESRAKKAPRHIEPEEIETYTPASENHKTPAKNEAGAESQEGAGSDTEGYIPFIKQYYD